MKKILIIDDDADMREVISTVLGKKYDVKAADSKKQGYEMVESFSPDLILLDVMMESTTSGFEMARDLKNNDNYKNIKIVILTSVDSESNIDFKSESGDSSWLPVDDYIEKPVVPDMLIDKMEKMLG
jgi:CheY-like chemotaxis protein